MKIITLIILSLLACTACTKKTATSSSTVNQPKSGTMTSGPASTTNSAQPRDLVGTWTVQQGGDVWELVITRTGPGTYSGSSTLVSTNDPNGLNGPPGSKGDDIVIISDEPGKFRVRWAKTENFHKAEFWAGTGTYDDNTFDFAGAYKGKRKA
jgi:hypothetical protein